MKNLRRVILLLSLISCLLLSCSIKKAYDIEVSQYNQSMDTTEQWTITTYNNFRCTSQTTVQNEDGTYTVTFVFATLKADYRLPGQK